MELSFELTKKQWQFACAREGEVLFGGAAGGGKSFAQVADALIYALKYPGIKQLVLRRTFPELRRSLLLTAFSLYPEGAAKYNETARRWAFSNGSIIEFGMLDTEGDVSKYQSAEYDIIRFDELTHFTKYQYTYLLSRVRGANNFPKQIKSTTNPGGIGHAWVKARFIAAGRAGEPFGKGRMRRVFIPARLSENIFLTRADPGYVERLRNLPENERKALLDGDWDIFEGQVFSEWRNNPEGYTSHVGTHVIEPFAVPRAWRRYRSFDFGYARPFAVQWWAVDFDGTLYLYRQWYGMKEGAPNEGLRLTPSEIARGILEIEGEHERGNTILGVADPSIWDKSRGESICEMFEREGVFWSRGDNTRMAGKMQLHYRLAFDEAGRPGMYVFRGCRDFLRTIPALLYDAKNVEDVDTRQEDHDYDACRYFLMTHPVAPRRSERVKEAGENPLDLFF